MGSLAGASTFVVPVRVVRAVSGVGEFNPAAMASTKSDAAKIMERIKDLDLYLLLDLETDATEKAVKKAYRKKALKCHPDKNPDNPKAAEEFHRLSDAYEVLSDEAARKAYDTVLKARKAAEIRKRQLDSKRRKLRDELEEREKRAKDDAEAEALNQNTIGKSDEEKLAEEIERLRRRGNAMLEEEQERIRDEIEKEKKSRRDANVSSSGTGSAQAQPSGGTKLKVRWKNDTDGRYGSESLRKIFSKYGDVAEVVVMDGSGGKKGSGLIEMSTPFAADMASKIEIGFSECPLKVKLLGEENSTKKAPRQEELFPSASSTSSSAFDNELSRETDFESLVMRKMRQEEERKRLIREMMERDQKEDEN